MFRTVPLSIIRSFSLYTQQWYMSYRFADSLRTICQQTLYNLWVDSELRFSADLSPTTFGEVTRRALVSVRIIDKN